ncbi:phosphotransferase [Agrobacterium rhizogenes]|nr:phosphotransferase [Rhizobium rhizogenes]
MSALPTPSEKEIRFVEGTYEAIIRDVLGSRVSAEPLKVVETPTPWSFTTPVLFEGRNAFVKIVAREEGVAGSIHHELEAAKQLSEIGVAPGVLFSDYANGIVVTEAVEVGGIPSMEGLVAALHSIHRSKIFLSPAIRQSRIQATISYLATLASDCRENRVFGKALEILASNYMLYEEGTALCHGDLNPTNVLSGPEGKVYLLDFDFSGAGNPIFDIATLSLWRCNTHRDMKEILELYYKKSATEEALGDFHAARKFVLARYACMTRWIAQIEQLPNDFPWEGSDLKAFRVPMLSEDKAMSVLRLAVSFAKALVNYDEDNLLSAE